MDNLKTNRKILKLDTVTRVEQEKKEKKKEDEAYQRSVNRSVSLALNLGFSISVPIVLGVGVGRFIDQRFSTAPSFSLLLMFVGVVIGVGQIIVLLKRDT